MPTPRRTQQTQAGSSQHGKHSDLVDLEFLPERYLKRIDDIFDSYFGLGMKKRTATMGQTPVPNFPEKVASLSSPDLGNTISLYSTWLSYTLDKAKYVTVAYNFLEQELQRVMDRKLGDMVADKGNIDAKKANARASEEYQTMLHYLQKLSGLKTLLDMEASSFDKSVQSLSREVSRRENNAGF